MEIPSLSRTPEILADLLFHIFDEWPHRLILHQLTELRLMPMGNQGFDLGNRDEPARLGRHQLVTRHSRLKANRNL